jgi:hypothetical protein
MLTLCPVIFDSVVPDHRFCKFAKNLASIPDHHLSLSNKAVCLYSWGPYTALLQTSPLTHTPKTTTAFCKCNSTRATFLKF